jgi:hypothetical protein
MMIGGRCIPRFFLAYPLALALASCTGDDLTISEPPETPIVGTDRASVTGLVVDADGAALAGATVTVRATGERATTDTTGAFVLDVPAHTTLTIAATAPGMAPTLLPQFMIDPGHSTAFTIPMVTNARLASLVALGPNPRGGVVAMTVKSLSGAPQPDSPLTIEITPSNFGKVMYAPESSGLPDPDPGLTAMGSGHDCIAWGLGVQPHVSTMTISLHGASQLALPYAVDDITWPGTFTVDAGALTLVTLFTP